MNYGIQRLAHLVELKNELNRKRRRFYHLFTPTYSYKDQTSKVRCKHKMFPIKYAKQQYRLTCDQMRALTKEMRELRKECGARLIWGASWNIKGIHCGDEAYNLKMVSRLAELYKADSILLGD